MEDEDPSGHRLDYYIRSLAACLAPDRPNSQFVGSKWLPTKLEKILPHWVETTEVTRGIIRPRRISSRDILQRLSELLQAGLKGKLHAACRGCSLTDNIFPQHLPVFWYNQRWRKWEGTGAVTVEACKAAVAWYPTISDRLDMSQKNPYGLHPPKPAQPAPLPGGRQSRASLPSFFARKRATALKRATTLHPPPEEGFLPYPIQHIFLPPIQLLLEESCHRYIRLHMPHLLKQKGWTVPQAAELQMYLREIVATWEGSPNALPVLNALPQLRHAAVHRVPISSARMDEFFDLAKDGATALGDGNVHFQIWRLGGLFNRTKRERKERVIWADRMEKRLKHLEHVKREIKKEELQWEAVAPKLNAWAEPMDLEVTAFQAEADSILHPGDRGKVDESKQEENDLPVREYSRVFDSFQPWEIVDIGSGVGCSETSYR